MKKKSKNVNSKAIIIAVVALLVVMAGVVAAVLIINNNKKDPLIGSWENGSYVYTFNEDGTCSYGYGSLGAMECVYHTEGDKISILYNGNTAPFETTYKIDGNQLNVIDSFGNNTIYTKK
ncbi:hypothetical protein IJG93_02605 [Candidatus Saccharibacteria bacterium]|nr:hypothetical protein [Candidatus Saccharibacteria bacterium]